MINFGKSKSKVGHWLMPNHWTYIENSWILRPPFKARCKVPVKHHSLKWIFLNSSHIPVSSLEITNIVLFCVPVSLSVGLREDLSWQCPIAAWTPLYTFSHSLAFHLWAFYRCVWRWTGKISNLIHSRIMTNCKRSYFLRSPHNVNNGHLAGSQFGDVFVSFQGSLILFLAYLMNASDGKSEKRVLSYVILLLLAPFPMYKEHMCDW